METRLLLPTQEGLETAASILRDGGLVAFPTETVYGLGADASNGRAVAGIFAAKERPSFNPLILHVADIAAAEVMAEFTQSARLLAAAFWPGPLTLVLPLQAKSALSPLVTAGLPSVALRSPAGGVAQSLLAAFGGPIAAPSANPSGRISASTAAHVMAGLAGRIDAVLDGGACSIGVESTILDLTGPPRLLRPGAVTEEALSEVIGTQIRGANRLDGAAPVAPGQLASHYAPRAPMRLDVRDPADEEMLLGFGPVSDAAFNLSPTGDLLEAAANLFSALHKLDAESRPIAVSPIPDAGIGRAINDRLRRAAAPRDQR